MLFLCDNLRAKTKIFEQQASPLLARVRYSKSLVILHSSYLQVVVGKDQKTFQQGEEIKLTCSVKGYPIPTIMWYRNNIALGKNERYSIDNDNTLLLAKSRTIDGGSYSCRQIQGANKKMNPLFNKFTPFVTVFPSNF